MIKIILIATSLVLLIWFLTNRNTTQARAGVKLGLTIFIFVGVFTIIFPNSANEIARLVGVGRGADLILYILTISFVALVLSLYIKSKEDQKRIVTLARKTAIFEANQNKQKFH